jgi:hypothetical protein
MRRLLTWLLVTLGIAAIVRRLTRRKRDAGQTDVAPISGAQAEDDPAEELRRKLAESRSEDEPAEPPTSPPAETVDERRAWVHERGRAALDEMDEPSDES